MTIYVTLWERKNAKTIQLRFAPEGHSSDWAGEITSIELGGMSQNQAAMTFHISRSTINLWCQRQVLTGDCKAKPNLPQGNGHKITDWEKFREFAKVNGEKTQVEMAKLWDGEISDREARHQGGRTISRALKKIGLTRKKRMQSR